MHESDRLINSDRTTLIVDIKQTRIVKVEGVARVDEKIGSDYIETNREFENRKHWGKITDRLTKTSTY